MSSHPPLWFGMAILFICQNGVQKNEKNLLKMKKRGEMFQKNRKKYKITLRKNEKYKIKQ